MSNRYLHLTIPDVEDIDEKRLVEVLNKAVDWLKTSPTTWLIRSKHGAATWLGRIHPIVGDGTLYVLEFDSEVAEAWMDDDYWLFLGYDKADLVTEDD